MTVKDTDDFDPVACQTVYDQVIPGLQNANAGMPVAKEPAGLRKQRKARDGLLYGADIGVGLPDTPVSS